jgi:hypothetical protein
MKRNSTAVSSRFVLALLCLSAFLLPVRAADDAMRTINNPGGGQIIYGPLPKETTLQGGLVTMLRNIHTHFGNRPDIGKLLQTRGNDSLATFFTVTPTPAGAKPLSGMVIVSMPPGSKVAAAVLFDDADRFNKTMNPMLKKLSEVWQTNVAKASSSQSNGAPSREGAVQPLHQVTFPDNSGSIGLPDGWKINRARLGGVAAEGPKGEMVVLSLVRTMYDPSTPQGQQALQAINRAGRGMPFGTGIGRYGDLVGAFMYLSTQGNRSMNLPTPTLNVTSTQNLPIPQNEGFGVLIIGEMDLKNGKGPMTSSIQITSGLRRDPSRWIITVNQVSVPKALADEEWPTMTAMVASWRQNGQVIQAHTNQVIAQIHQVGENAKRQADAAHAANDAHNAAVEAKWDNDAKQSKSFQEYQLDQSVILDKNSGDHKTYSNQYADFLVKTDPDRFQYVQKADLLKGQDY